MLSYLVVLIFLLAEGLELRARAGMLLFTLFWLIGWLAGGGLAASVFFWQVAGMERLTIAEGRLTVQRKIPYFARERVYPLGDLRNLGLRRERNFSGMPASWRTSRGFVSSFAAGAVAFMHDGREAGVGLDLSTEEAEALVERLRPFAPADARPTS